MPIVDSSNPIRKRSSKSLLSIIVIALCCGFFACSGCCFLTKFLFRPQVVNSPQGADEAASRITSWSPPANFVGKTGSTMDNAVLRLDVVRYEHQLGRGILILGQLNSKLYRVADPDPQLQQLVEKLAHVLKKIDLDHRETRTLTIREAQADFEIGRGEDRATTTRFRQVVGHFQGKVDRAIVILQCEEAFITDEEIDEFLKSIK